MEGTGEKTKGTSGIINKAQIFEKNAKHIFRDAPGHLLDTPANRALLIDLISDSKNFLGPDQNGVQWFGKIMSDSKQLWASVWENSIRNGGINETPKIFNSETGLCRLLPKGKK